MLQVSGACAFCGLYTVKRDRESVLRRGRQLLEENRRLRAAAQQKLAEARQAGEYLSWVVTEIKRQRQADFYRQMQAGIQRMHRCESRHEASFAVRKVSAEGKTVWEGTVEEFALVGCRTAQTCYAWYYREHDRTQSFSVLKRSPVCSPQNAVQFALAAWKLPPLVEFEVR